MHLDGLFSKTVNSRDIVVQMVCPVHSLTLCRGVYLSSGAVQQNAKQCKGHFLGLMVIHMISRAQIDSTKSSARVAFDSIPRSVTANLIG